MIPMKEVIQKSAQQIAPELDRLITQFFADMRDQKRSSDLHKYLWDNKIGILRVLQYVAKPKE